MDSCSEIDFSFSIRSKNKTFQPSRSAPKKATAAELDNKDPDSDSTIYSNDFILESVASENTHSDTEITLSDGHVKSSSLESSSNTENDSNSDAQTPTLISASLSPWQQWMLKKENFLQAKKKEDILREMKDAEIQEKLKKEKQRTKEKAAVVFSDWCERKHRENVEHLKLQKEEQIKIKLAGVEKKLNTEAQAKEKWKIWLRNKLHEETAIKQKDEEKVKTEKEKKLKKEKDSQSAFQEWLNTTSIRPRREYKSTAYLGGKIINEILQTIMWSNLHIFVSSYFHHLAVSFPLGILHILVAVLQSIHYLRRESTFAF
ncbi:uncharacterized protein LOC143230313 isoform X2 [Tachypleus tridentatus]|uniref:uncharacterized protein LOC143230313 isoform X2 n=1 Tax=Tachypleus tridentatus TaxID=6853 RepID=UPI003FD4F57D